MGEGKRYYYIKQKTKAYSQAVDFKYEKPQVVTQPFFSGAKVSKSGESVLNMDFANAINAKTGVVVARWVLLAVLTVSIYLAGSLISSEVDYTKEDLIRKSEAAAINLQAGAAALSQFDLEDALINFKLADRNFESTLNSFASLGQNNILLASLPLERSQIVQAQSLVLGGQHLAKSGIYTIEAITPVLKQWVYPEETEKIENFGSEIGNLLINNNTKLVQALEEVTLAQKYFSGLSVQYLPPEYAGLVSETQTKTQQFRQGLEMVASLAKNLPDALGFDNPRHYMLLNQNPNEARATGGFIGSYAIVEVYQGEVVDVFADTTQRIDGQNLYNDMVLPEPLESVTAYYGIRDANWDPHFASSALTIQELYEQAGGGTVDGVIALNPDIVADILSVTGPIYMDEYDMTLTGENFADRVQKHIEVDARGSYDSKQLLIDVIPIVMTRLLNADAYQVEQLGQKILYRLVTKDIILQFSNPELEAVVNTLGWGGSITEVDSGVDYLYVVESNLGGNKSSSSLVRNISHTAAVSSRGNVTDYVKLHYSHQGTDQFPDGISKNYIRVYLPNGSDLDSLSGYDEDTTIDTDTQNGKTVLGFWLTLNPGETKTVEIKYDLPFRLEFIDQKTEYQLVLQKQPGLQKTEFISQIELGNGLSLENPGALMLFSDRLTKDEVITVDIYKK